MTKMYSNLRAARQLENMGKYSSAISCLEEFLTENPGYENTDNIILKIKSPQEKQRTQGDSTLKLDFKHSIVTHCPRATSCYLHCT